MYTLKLYPPPTAPWFHVQRSCLPFCRGSQIPPVLSEGKSVEFKWWVLFHAVSIQSLGWFAIRQVKHVPATTFWKLRGFFFFWLLSPLRTWCRTFPTDIYDHLQVTRKALRRHGFEKSKTLPPSPIHTFLHAVSDCRSVMKLTSADERFWCFHRAVELYQQRIQWLTENSRKVRHRDFFLQPLLLIPVTVLSVAKDLPTSAGFS